jgi:hypothetical protein
MGMQILTHIIALQLHIQAKLVEARGTDHVTLSINLPGNGCVLRANFIINLGASSGPRVERHIRANVLLWVFEHSLDQVRIDVGFIIGNGEDLSLYSHVVGDRQRLLQCTVGGNSGIDGGQWKDWTDRYGIPRENLNSDDCMRRNDLIWL